MRALVPNHWSREFASLQSPVATVSHSFQMTCLDCKQLSRPITLLAGHQPPRGDVYLHCVTCNRITTQRHLASGGEDVTRP